MSTSESFKNMYKDFINELLKEFPHIDDIKNEKFNTFKFKGDHMKRFTKRMQIPQNYTHCIANRDESIFSSDCKLVKDTGLDKIWIEASDESKEVIWQYLTTMNMLVTTVSSIPPNMLKNIETMAAKIANDMQGSDFNNCDFSDMMKNVEGMMKNMKK